MTHESEWNMAILFSLACAASSAIFENKTERKQARCAGGIKIELYTADLHSV